MPTNAPRSPGSTPPPSGDDEMARYLANVELESLDLGDVDLGEPRKAPSSALLVACAGLALLHGIGTALFPWTVVYQLRSYGETVWLTLIAIEALLVAFLIRGARRFYSQRAGNTQTGTTTKATLVTLADDGTWVEGPDLETDEAPSVADAVAALVRALDPWRRRLLAMSAQHRLLVLFAVIFVLGLLLAFVLPREAQWSGGTYSLLWFVTVAIATGTGILVGRFIMAAGEQDKHRDLPLPPIQFPPWMRWFNLGLLCLGALVATFGPSLVSAQSPSGDFGFAIIGLITGISGAIWIARRFDEWEAGFREEAEQKARPTFAEGLPRPPAPVVDDAGEH